MRCTLSLCEVQRVLIWLGRRKGASNVPPLIDESRWNGRLRSAAIFSESAQHAQRIGEMRHPSMVIHH